MLKNTPMEETMNCPYCHHKNHLEIDLHADGFSKDLLECSECGAILEVNGQGQLLATIRKPIKPFFSTAETAAQSLPEI